MKQLRPFIAVCCVIFSTANISAQNKKSLDHTVYDSWQSIKGAVISDDGKTIAYTVAPQVGDTELFIRTSDTTYSISRGTRPRISSDNNYIVFSITAPYDSTRQARIKKSKNLPKDSLGILDLGAKAIVKYPNARAIRTELEFNNVVCFETGGKDKELIVLSGSAADTLLHFDKYSVNRQGTKMAVCFKEKDSVSNRRAEIIDLLTKERTLISENESWYGTPKFNEEGDKVAILASLDSNKTGSKRCHILLTEGTETIDINPEGIPDGQCLDVNSPIRFSKNSDRLFVGTSDILPEDDTTLVSFETAKLDIWNYDKFLIPPMEKIELSNIKAKTYFAMIDLMNPDKLIPLSNSLTEEITLIDGGEGDKAIGVDKAPYLLTATWDNNIFFDVYEIDLRDGSRKPLFEKHEGRATLSPNGKYLYWYNDRNWYVYNLETSVTKSLTKNLKGTFYNGDDDHPFHKPSFGSPTWIDNDKALILNEKYDLILVDPETLEAKNLTNHSGEQQFRITWIDKNPISSTLSEVDVKRSISKDDTLTLKVFDKATKENGYATVKAGIPGLLSCFTKPAWYEEVHKASASNAIIYTKGSFVDNNDLYVTEDNWESETRLSSINPQQAEYNWGNIQLVHWKAYDGKKLDGLLITPEDLDPSKKYPMIAYFYERNSQELYRHHDPVPSRSIINFPFYASRGYVIFIPDISYKDGHPGESAYNCICSGVESMCKQFPFIDKAHVGMQGQSWGGYQTAYLATRTDMFAAAGSGAPVGNMTSAYGGIRWESGVIRASQYEHGQSRIGKSLWDKGGLKLYIENSPVFHADKVKTPMLIMHNDADGAVPWYQGIELFMALRRCGSPAWLLEYNDEAHNLKDRCNRKDLSQRLQQFFDYYLKGEPMPAWMKTGIPITRKGQYFGFEPAE